ncbi:hypothetical protein VB780_18865 [Leptolyngbya sp. CCNP1308]|uniref:hypothetical protein n=1 Tax=Leptolyngbya sp. CCNP1308 TaxID=3110255 RepID=UPI002B2158E3|nr:hypothetical protein [Leptolyngbya sp. CCNP1308]MEA5450648.1 hypothetical protein [Leptolyngbya sp. CCNP1308]
MNPQLKAFSRLVGGCLAVLLVFTLVFGGGEARALTLDEDLTSAGKSYLSSVLKDYAKEAQDTYGSSLKQAQKLVNGLAEDLEEAADPDTKIGDRAAILTSINTSKAALTDLAASFSGLATETATFDSQLQASVEDLLKLVKGDVRTQLTQNEDNFKKIADTLTALANDAGKIDDANLSNLLGSVGDHITALNTAFDVGGKALKASASLTK